MKSEEFAKSIGVRLKDLRKQNKLGAYDVSSSCRITLEEYKHFEEGKKIPTLKQTIQIAEFYKLSLDDLINPTNSASNAY